MQTLESKFPPHRFPSIETLEAWLAEDDISELPDAEFAEGIYKKALELQKRAAEDGYLIGADLFDHEDGTFTITNSAIVENNYYWWLPEEDEVFFQLNLNAF